MVDSWGTSWFNTVRADFVQEFRDVSGHRYRNMAVSAIYPDIHSEVLGPLPINFVNYEILYALFVFPNDSKVVDDERNRILPSEFRNKGSECLS